MYLAMLLVVGDTGDIAGEWTQRTTRLPLTFKRVPPLR